MIFETNINYPVALLTIALFVVLIFIKVLCWYIMLYLIYLLLTHHPNFICKLFDSENVCFFFMVFLVLYAATRFCLVGPSMAAFRLFCCILLVPLICFLFTFKNQDSKYEGIPLFTIILLLLWLSMV